MRTEITPTFDLAFNLMKVITQQVRLHNLDDYGLQLLRQNQPWLGSDRATVRNTFDNLLFQSLDLIGLPRLVVPVEYVAAAIVAFVHPVNYMIACFWSESHGATADELALDGEYDKFSARMLFAVVCHTAALDRSGRGPGTFETVMDKKISDALNPVEEPEWESENVDSIK